MGEAVKIKHSFSQTQLLNRVGSRVTDEIAHEARRKGTVMLPLSAYPTRKMPPAILEAMVAELGVSTHPPSAGIPELREAMADELKAELGWRPDPDTEILVTAGGMHAVQLALLAVLNRRDQALIFTPSYFFDGLIHLCGGIPKSVPCDPDANFQMEASMLRPFAKARALVFNTPCNPTGVIPDAAEIERLALWAKKTGAVIVSDESYDKLVYDDAKHVSFFSSKTGRQHGLLVRSFTKSFGMPQWRVGFLVGRAEWIANAKKALEWTNLFGPHLNQKIAACVLRSNRSWLDGVAGEFQRNRDALLKGLKNIEGVRSTLPRGNPFVFLQIEGLGKKDVAFSRMLIEKHGIPNTPGTYHGLPGWLRVPFGGPIEAVREASHRLTTAIEEFHAKVG